ncbi:toll-like receptor 13 [Ostrea edulis]|uniref:toll-like receptor 13 n=1 Tax=Ostrea edulis TaxID=37623 RepID=UPI0024AFD3E3|nr:toll-like receptor 13 [Ostrea edulis]
MLDLSGNNMHVNQVQNAFVGLQNTKLRILYISAMHLKALPEAFFFHMKNSNLTQVVMDNDLLNTFQAVVFIVPPKLQKISLAQNNISSVSLNKQLHLLEELDLSKNNMRTVPLFCNRTSEPYLPRLKVLDISSNLISKIKPRAFLGTCLPNLTHLIISDNKIEYLPNKMISRLVNLVSLSIKHLGDNIVIGPWALNSSSLKYLHMENRFNIFERPEYEMLFWGCPNLIFLDMTDVQFTHQNETKSKAFTLFSPLHRLQDLILKGTSLSVLPENLFSGMSNLTNLSLENCKLSQWTNEVFSKAVSLKSLQLGHNLISIINQTSLPLRVEKIDLQGNPFLCSCDLVWFRDWIRENSNKLSGWSTDYTCKQPSNWDGKNLIDFHLSYIYCHPLNPITILGISISVLSVVILVASGVLYHYRWHIKYHLYLLRAKSRGYEALSGCEFVYDVFIAYNSNDRVWVISEMIPILEKQENMKLCLHERDFEIGKMIIDNITDTMQKSRKILLILSNNFAESHWCRFETMMAQIRSMNDGENMVVVILLERIQTKNITNSLHVLLNTTTYIEWKNKENEKELFWQRLVSALKS